jgi:hypothetical protein
MRDKPLMALAGALVASSMGITDLSSGFPTSGKKRRPSKYNPKDEDRKHRIERGIPLPSDLKEQS